MDVGVACSAPDAQLYDRRRQELSLDVLLLRTSGPNGVRDRANLLDHRSPDSNQLPQFGTMLPVHQQRDSGVLEHMARNAAQDQLAQA